MIVTKQLRETRKSLEKQLKIKSHEIKHNILLKVYFFVPIIIASISTLSGIDLSTSIFFLITFSIYIMSDLLSYIDLSSYNGYSTILSKSKKLLLYSYLCCIIYELFTFISFKFKIPNSHNLELLIPIWVLFNTLSVFIIYDSVHRYYEPKIERIRKLKKKIFKDENEHEDELSYDINKNFLSEYDKGLLELADQYYKEIIDKESFQDFDELFETIKNLEYLQDLEYSFYEKVAFRKKNSKPYNNGYKQIFMENLNKKRFH